MSEIILLKNMGLDHSPDTQEILRLFREISGIESLISSDSEGFNESGRSYIDLLEKMQVISEGKIAFSDLTAKESDFSRDTGIYPVTIQLEINDESHAFPVDAEKDYLAVVDYINNYISRQGGERRFFFVEPYTKENADQVFYLAFISQKVYERLTEKGFTHESLTAEQEEDLRLDVSAFFDDHVSSLEGIIQDLDYYGTDEDTRKLFLIPEEITWLDTIRGKKIKSRSQLGEVMKETNKLLYLRKKAFDDDWISGDFDKELAEIYDRINLILEKR
jgi:phage-related protein